MTATNLIVALTSALLLAPPAPPAAAEPPSPAKLTKRIDTAARHLEVVVEKFNDAREDLAATQARSARLTAQLGPLTTDLAQRRLVMGGLATRTYQRTRSGPTVALFGAQDPHEFVAKLLVLHQLAVAEQRAVTDLHAAKTKVAGTRRMLALLANRQRQLRFQLSARKAAVEGEIETLKQMRTIAYGTGTRYAPGRAGQMPMYVPGRAGSVVAFAFEQVGKPYRWGAAGPWSYDCSGLVLAAWQRAGVGLPHNAARQYGATTRVSRSELRPGDLVFFYGPISHVGVYIGGGRMIHAPQYGENIRLAAIDQQPIAGYGRPG